MISFRASTTLPILALLATLAGCAAQTSSAESATAPQETVAAQAQGPQARGPEFRGGPQSFLLVAALREPTLNLTDAQRATIEAALKSTEPQGPPPDQQARTTALAAQVRAGKIDTTTMPSGPTDAEKSAHIAASAKALYTLHATLTADQRTALVAAVSKGGEHRGPRGDHEGHQHGDHGPSGERGERGERGPMGGLLADLDLTQAQKDAIHTKMEANKPSDSDREAMKAKMESFHTAQQAKLQTFASDSFDATAFATPPADAMNKGHEDHMAKELSVIVSVLEPAQREVLAKKLEQGPQARPAATSVAQPKPGTAL